MALEQVKLRANKPARNVTLYAPSRAKSLRCYGHGVYNYFDSLRANVIEGMVHYM